MTGKIEYYGEMLSLTAIADKESVPKTSLGRKYEQTGNIYEAVKLCKESLIEKIEYNGEQLAIKTIAKREEINNDSLNREYKKTGDIYQAVRICKENQTKRKEKIQYFEYNGETLTIKEIANKEGLTESSLRNAYQDIKNIYEAVKICKENQQNKKGNIEYNGEYLTLAKIAKLEKIPENTLRRNYTEIGNIYEAVRICKENKENRDNKKIEYNGEILSIIVIADREHISPNPLIKRYKELGDIYEAVKICKENQQKHKGTIEYNGEKLTINAIATKEGLSKQSLSNAYEKTDDIYEAVKLCKKNQKSKNVLIEYNGKQMTILEIANEEKIKEDALRRAYKKTGNIYEAVGVCKENKKNKTIEYNGEMLTIGAIAKREKITPDSLAKAYKDKDDIYEAVRICKENQAKRNKSIQRIEYYGKMMTIKAIADKEGLVPHSLKETYNKIGDIYEAVRLCKENQKTFNGSIEYNGEMLSLVAIADKEHIAKETLRKRYKETGNIYKAVFICQSVKAERERRKIKVDTSEYGRISYYDLSLILGIKYGELKNLLDKGYTAEQIVNMNLRPTLQRNVSSRIYTKLPNGQSLNEYCIENSLNYACIYRAINIYGRSLEEAVDFFKKNGQQIPARWIYEKYGVLLKHLLLKEKIDIKNVIEYMRKDLISLDEAVERCVVRNNAKKAGLNEEWITELYDVLTDENIKDEYDDYLKTFYVEDKEEDCIIKSYDEVETFKRKELLFEIAEALREGVFNPEEEPELLRMYNIKPKEIEIIFLELYDRFDESGVLIGEEMQKERTSEEMEAINDKIRKYQRMLQDNDILDIMHTAVGEKVADNQDTRQELQTKLKLNESKSHN